MRCAAAFNMQTARPVTRFAADVLRVFSMCLQTRMRSRPKIARDIFVTGFATLGTNKFRARDARRRENRSVCLKGAARKENHGERGCSPDAPKKFFALTVDPSS